MNNQETQEVATTAAEQIFQDLKLNCIDCRQSFTWSAGEQKFYAERKLDHRPKRCDRCRKRSKQAAGAELLRGTVKWFNTSMGYGFILIPGRDDAYVHFTAIITHGYASLLAGQSVEFNLVQTPKGPAAANVRVVENGDANE